MDKETIENFDLFQYERSQGGELSNVLANFSDSIGNIIELRAGKQNVKEWVEKYRILYGKPFSYTNAEVAMMLGEKDKELRIAPRPYLDKYLADRCMEKSIIKCRQCLTGETTIITINEKGEKEYKKIRDLYKENYRGKILYNKNGKNTIGEVVKVWDSGEKEILEFRTKDGHK